MPAHVKVTIAVLAHRRRTALHAVDFNMLTSTNIWRIGRHFAAPLSLAVSHQPSVDRCLFFSFLAALGLLTCLSGVPLPPLPIGIIELRAKTTKIFGFKGVIWKIFRNKDLTDILRSPHPSLRPSWETDTPMKKGCGSDPHPYSYSITLLYQFQPTYPDNFPDFIFLANSLTYEVNRHNRGLTRFS